MFEYGNWTIVYLLVNCRLRKFGNKERLFACINIDLVLLDGYNNEKVFQHFAISFLVQKHPYNSSMGMRFRNFHGVALGCADELFGREKEKN